MSPKVPIFDKTIRKRSPRRQQQPATTRVMHPAGPSFWSGANSAKVFSASTRRCLKLGSMSTRHSKATIIGIAIVSIGLAALLHEGLGHGVTAALRGDVVTELTSNHLSSLRPDRLVDCGGTIANLIAGAICLIASRFAGRRANVRFFLWFFAGVNLLQGAGYFMFSGILGVGDWNAVIAALPNQVTLHVAM